MTLKEPSLSFIFFGVLVFLVLNRSRQPPPKQSHGVANPTCPAPQSPIPDFLRQTQCLTNNHVEKIVPTVEPHSNRQPLPTPTPIKQEPQPENKELSENQREFRSCYTTPDEEFLFSSYHTYTMTKELCNSEKYINSREHAYIPNPHISCVSGFVEAQTYFNVVSRSSTTSKFGNYWCSIRRVCCSY